MKKVLVFDIWGEYAHFRKYYTTTSPLSYSIPPRTAITGLIGAIIGLGKNEYLKHFTKSQAFIAVRLLEPIKKVRIAENLIDTSSVSTMNRIKNRTRIRFEFIKDARYRIYFYHTNKEIYSQTKEYIIAHKCVYTPCLGLSEHIANFECVGEMNMHHVIPNGFNIISSAIPENLIEEIDFGQNGEYSSETMPIEMDTDRTVIEYSNILFERNGRTIRAKLKEFWELDNGEKLVFM